VDGFIMSSHTVNSPTFRALVEATASAGVPAIALTYDQYRRFSRAGESDAEMQAIAASNGVRVVDIEALFAVLEADPSGRTAAHAERLFGLAEVFGAQSIGTHSNFDGDMEVAAGRLRSLCDTAAARGLSVGVEPVPVMTLGDLATAWDVIEYSGAANAGLVLDTWHFSRGAGTLEMVRALPARAFRTVQISDGALAGPPDLGYLDDTLTNRLPPGEGEFDLTGIVQALLAIGADVRWDMEICSSLLDALPGTEAALRATKATRAVLAAAGWPSIEAAT
jgi:sugar phosphate isomerase/epimerase